MIASCFTIDSPRVPRRAIDTVAAPPARGRVVSSQTRSMRAVRDCSVASIVKLMRSTVDHIGRVLEQGGERRGDVRGGTAGRLITSENILERDVGLGANLRRALNRK